MAVAKTTPCFMSGLVPHGLAKTMQDVHEIVERKFDGYERRGKEKCRCVEEHQKPWLS